MDKIKDNVGISKKVVILGDSVTAITAGINEHNKSMNVKNDSARKVPDNCVEIKIPAAPSNISSNVLPTTKGTMPVLNVPFELASKAAIPLGSLRRTASTGSYILQCQHSKILQLKLNKPLSPVSTITTTVAAATSTTAATVTPVASSTSSSYLTEAAVTKITNAKLAAAAAAIRENQKHPSLVPIKLKNFPKDLKITRTSAKNVPTIYSIKPNNNEIPLITKLSKSTNSLLNLKQIRIKRVTKSPATPTTTTTVSIVGTPATTTGTSATSILSPQVPSKISDLLTSSIITAKESISTIPASLVPLSSSSNTTPAPTLERLELIKLQKCKMINVQISNGKLSDPNGPIKLLGENQSPLRSSSSSPKDLKRKLSNDAMNITKPSNSNLKTVTNLTEEEIDKNDDNSSSKVRVKSMDLLSTANKKDKSYKNNAKSNDKSDKNQTIFLLAQAQSLTVKNKFLTKVQTSPRMAKRSKSLNANFVNFKKPYMRRLSEPVKSENDEINGTNSEKKHCEKSLGSEDLLLCNETFDNSSEENKSLLSKSNSGSVEILPDIGGNKLNTIEISDTESINQDTDRRSVNRKRKSDAEVVKRIHALCKRPNYDIEDDPFDLIKWNDGIGYLFGSNLHFQFDEFGLIDLIDDSDFMRYQETKVKSKYDKPIYEREVDPNRSNRIMDSMEPIYDCQGCFCHGIASEFITPDFCSTACIKRSGSLRQTLKQMMVKNNEKKGDSNISAVNWHGSDTSTAFNTPRDSDEESLTSHSAISNQILDLNEDSNSNQKKRSYPSTANSPPMSWDMNESSRISTPMVAPINYFINGNTAITNAFQVSQKLEAIDPANCHLFCVATISEIRGARIKIHFDGYPSEFDFWVNCDSKDIFPAGWCQKYKRKLHRPQGHPRLFNWVTYMSSTKSTAAPYNLFKHVLKRSDLDNGFKIGMKLEADDIKGSGQLCLATIVDKIQDRVLIHFDGKHRFYDYWCDVDSPSIHPINYHAMNNYKLSVPKEHEENFTWKSYLTKTKSCPVPWNVFNTREPVQFEIGMKLTVVDRCLPQLIRPATIIDIDGIELKLLYNNWHECYAFWVDDDSPDIHPINWCARTNHPLEFDSHSKDSCGVKYCRGLGNYNSSDEYKFHTSIEDCPYHISNYRRHPKRKSRFYHFNFQHLQFIPYFSLHKKRNFKNINTTENNIQQSKNTTENIHKLGLQQKLIYNEIIDDKLALRLSVTKTILDDYGPRLKQSYDLWKENSKILFAHTRNGQRYVNPLLWSTNDVCNYVNRLPNCANITETFRQNEINGNAFLSLTQDDLVKCLKLRLGAAVKIYSAIVNLREEVSEKYLEY